MRWKILLAFLGSLFVTAVYAQTPAVDCEQELGQALERSHNQQMLALHSTEAMVKYFQREVIKLRQEVAELKKQLNKSDPPLAPEKPAN